MIMYDVLSSPLAQAAMAQFIREKRVDETAIKPGQYINEHNSAVMCRHKNVKRPLRLMGLAMQGIICLVYMWPHC